MTASVHELLARLGRALAAPARIAIMDVLAQAPRSVEDLAAAIGQSVANTSQHRRGSGVFRAKVVDEKSRPGLVFVHMHDHNRMSNVLTIDAVDPVSKQPEFKICSIRIEKV